MRIFPLLLYFPTCFIFPLIFFSYFESISSIVFYFSIGYIKLKYIAFYYLYQKYLSNGKYLFGVYLIFILHLLFSSYKYSYYYILIYYEYLYLYLNKQKSFLIFNFLPLMLIINVLYHNLPIFKFIIWEYFLYFLEYLSRYFLCCLFSEKNT